MHALAEFLRAQPEIALFISLALGYLIGNRKVGPFSLGGVCGTLIVALMLGQAGVRLSADRLKRPCCSGGPAIQLQGPGPTHTKEKDYACLSGNE